MAESYKNTLANICARLHKHEVAFLMIGGAAVGFYGYARLSTQADGTISEKPDFDFWYNPTYENYYRLLHALAEFGVDVSRYISEKTPQPHKSFFRFELSACTIDFLPILRVPIKFSKAYLTREEVMIEGIIVPIIGLDDLVGDKQNQPRDKDMKDVEMLQRIKDGNQPET